MATRESKREKIIQVCNVHRHTPFLFLSFSLLLNGEFQMKWHESNESKRMFDNGLKMCHKRGWLFSFLSLSLSLSHFSTLAFCLFIDVRGCACVASHLVKCNCCVSILFQSFCFFFFLFLFEIFPRFFFGFIFSLSVFSAQSSVRLCELWSRLNICCIVAVVVCVFRYFFMCFVRVLGVCAFFPSFFRKNK